MSDSCDGLFSVKCGCLETYNPSQFKECPACNQNQIDKNILLLDANFFFERVYALELDNKKAAALYLIFEVFDHTYDKWHLKNEILKQADVSKLSGGALCSILTNTFKYSEQVPQHKIFFNKVKEEYLKRGKTEEQVKGILIGLEGAGNYWEDMKKLGATNPLMWGPNPNK